jgi:transcriptional regulator with XRE-family HTH domain
MSSVGGDPRARFGRNVLAARKLAGLSQSQLAEKSGIHSTEISRMERGLRNPRLTTIIRLARAVGYRESAQLLVNVDPWWPSETAAAMAGIFANGKEGTVGAP